MDECRIHIFGPSGSGTSTLGRALASALATQHFDADDFYWRPTDPPFREKREPTARRALMEDLFLPRRDWILSGSIDSWAGAIPGRFTLAVRLELDRDTRRKRLLAREQRRYGSQMEQGSAEYLAQLAFLEWADGYESGNRAGRSLARDMAFSQTLQCDVLVLNSVEPVSALVAQVLRTVDPARPTP